MYYLNFASPERNLCYKSLFINVISGKKLLPGLTLQVTGRLTE